MPHGDLQWDVRLPRRPGAGAGASRDASVVVSSDSHGEESIRVPVRVARALSSRRESGRLAPASRAELLHAIGEASRAEVRSRIEEMLNRRDYSCQELSQRLRRDGFSGPVAEEGVSWARDLGLVDDARYGAAFARAKAACGWGPIKVSCELARRGVEAESLPGWPDEFFSAEDLVERARALLSRRRPTGRNDFQKAVRFLRSRGFPPGMCFDVAREVFGPRD